MIELLGRIKDLLRTATPLPQSVATRVTIVLLLYVTAACGGRAASPATPVGTDISATRPAATATRGEPSTTPLTTGTSAPETASPPPVSSSSLPPGGLAPEAAVTRAEYYVPSDAKLTSAAAGEFAKVASDSRVSPQDLGKPMKPTDLVWAVRFEMLASICPPDGSACWSPRPGRSTVVLDYVTGEFVMSYSFSPAISPAISPR